MSFKVLQHIAIKDNFKTNTTTKHTWSKVRE